MTAFWKWAEITNQECYIGCAVSPWFFSAISNDDDSSWENMHGFLLKHQRRRVCSYRICEKMSLFLKGAGNTTHENTQIST